MAKKKKEALNVLVTEGTRQAIRELAESLECSQGEVVDRALVLLGANDLVARGLEGISIPLRDVSVGEPIEEPEDIGPMSDAGFDPRNIRGVSAPIPDVTSGYLPCRHCGLDGQISSRTNPWRACGDCQKRGHLNFERCSQCANDSHQREMESKSTSSDPSKIDFTAFND